MFVVQIDTLMDKWTRWMKAKMAGCGQIDGWMDERENGGVRMPGWMNGDGGQKV